MSTLFTKIIQREIPADIVYEDDLCLAFNDIAPVSPKHVLVIPKKEIPSIHDADDSDKEVLGHLLLTAKKVAIDLGLDKKGYRLTINTFEDGGQTVPHLHVHLMGGRSMTWPPG